MNYRVVFVKYIALLALFTVLPMRKADAQSENVRFNGADKPKLIVEVIANGLRYDQLLRFGQNLSDSGFVHIAKGGSVFTNARSSYMYTSPECGAASLASGCNPSSHGIVGRQWINFTTNEKVELFKDTKYIGVGCNEDEGQFSPEMLASSTLADEIKSLSPNSKVYSISMDCNEAILHGGYNPNGCYWFDVRYGTFVTSTYYQQTLPLWLQNFNASNTKWDYLNKLWQVEYDYDNYKYRNASSIITKRNTKFSFDMLFRPKNNEFKRLRETPYGDNYLMDMAIETIKSDTLGMDDATDLIVINTSSMRDVATIYGTSSTETEDALYKLDNSIAKLVRHLDENIGKDNYLLILTSSHGMSDKVTKAAAANQGKFNALQFKVMMAGFLNAQLGADNWIVNYSNRQIYLNRRLIYEKGESIVDVQNKLATFALQFAGVSHAVTATTLQSNSFGNGVLSKMQNSFFPRHSGDLIINLLPGWIEIESEDDVVTSSSWGSPYQYDTHMPLMFYGKDIEPKVVHEAVDIIDIAPTISEIVGVPHPNSSEGKSIEPIILMK